jgi:translation initiation factor 2 alpha subunit (eIF-2alpha)
MSLFGTSIAKGRSNIMTDKKETDVTGNLVESIQEVNRKIAESFVAAQERNLKFAQSTFTGAMEVIKENMESAGALMKEFEQQAQKQQEAFQKTAPGTGNVPSYLDLFRTPLTAYQKVLEATESATKQGVENFEKVIETLQHTTKQSMDDMRKATRHTHSTAKGTKE